MKKMLIFVIGFFCLVGVISFKFTHLSHKQVDYNGSNLMVNVDGESVDKLPTSGEYYLASYDCKSSNTVVTWDKENYQLHISNGNKKGGVSCYLEFKTRPNLFEMPVGSYVEYSGTNGCYGESCSGSNVGSCPGNEFDHQGWRIAYVSEKAYLISAGAVDCGNQTELSNKVLKYCNYSFVDGGSCDSNTVRVINNDDFSIIANEGLDMVACYNKQDKKCGYTNDLIDIGGDYWYSSVYQEGVSFYWSSVRRSLMNNLNNNNMSIRPVIKMDNNVIVVGGNGTEDNPYKIANNNFVIGKINKNDKNVSLKMIGYQVKEMCINLNSTACTNYVPFDDNYVLDISKARDERNVIYVYYKDADGNVIYTMNKDFSLKNV